jgi:hypothetical protein
MKRYLLPLIALLVCAPALAIAPTITNYANNAVRFSGSAAADNAELFTAVNTVGFDHCMLMSPDGAVDVFVSIDGTNFTTAPLSLQDLGATTSDPVLVTTADRMYAVNGKYVSILVQQAGMTAASASLLCWKK